MSKKLKILRWGPYPGQGQLFGGGIGGYARYNSQALRSFLTGEVDLVPLSMTVPHFRQPLLFYLHLVYRMIKDVMIITWGLMSIRPDVLHITALYWRSIYREWYAVRLAKVLNIPVIYDIRAGTFTEFCQQSSVIQQWLIQDVLAQSSQVAIQGKSSQQYVANRYGREVTWLPNCFLTNDLDKYTPAQLMQPEFHEPLRLTFLGYVIAEKGADILLAVAEQLSQQLPVSVTLIGEVSPEFQSVLDGYLKVQSPGLQIRALGRLEFAEVLKELQNQHLFIFLSRFFGEGHPNAINEAMAMGLPIIASRQGFLNDVVTPDCGILFDDPQDTRAITEAILTLRQDWERVQAMGKAARERVATVFSDQHVLKQMLELYHKAADSQ